MSKIYSGFPENYELIDAGGGRKLERWGTIVTIRPEHQAYFAPALTAAEWKKQAHWEFLPEKPASLNGKWKALKPDSPKQWIFHTSGIQLNVEITGNKHIGVFPEQAYNWNFIQQRLKAEQRFLNLFAYTGAASLAGRTTGAEVTHVDSVRTMIDWARINMESSGLNDIRWVVEDARKFVLRELKRGNKYDLIQMDPPAWGIGAKGEKWKIEDLLPDLIREGIDLLNKKGTLIVNTYSPKIELEDLKQVIKLIDTRVSADVQELWMKTTTGKSLFYGLVARIGK